MHRLSSCLIALWLAACGGAAQTGPAWPKSAGSMVPDDWREDGGESLEPQVVAEVSEDEDEDEEVAAEEVVADEVVEAVEDKPADAEEPAPDAPSVDIPADEILIEEEIIIEVE